MPINRYARYGPCSTALHRRARTSAHVWLAVAFGALITFTACDNTVDPFAETSRRAFAVYGYLDSRVDTQFVRVTPVIGASGFEYGESLDAEVILTDLHRGTTVALQDFSVALEDGRRAYVYYTLAKPLAGTAYRLDVYSPGGGDTTDAVTHMPGPDQVIVGDAERDVTGRYMQMVRWLDVSTVRDIVVHYELRVGASVTTVSVDYPSPRAGVSNETRLNLEWDRDIVLRSLPAGTDTSDVALRGVNVTADLASREWGMIADSPSEFFAAVGRVHREWTLPDSVVTAMGYRLP